MRLAVRKLFARQSPAALRNYLLIMMAALIAEIGCAGQLVDPTRPDYYTGANSAFIQKLKNSFKLSSIIVGDHRRTAVINGVNVREGEQVGEGIVKKIDRFSVTIEAQGARFNIALSENNFKKRQNKR